MARQQLQLAIKPQEFFHEKVTHAAESLKIEIDDEIEFYVVNLLCEFINTTKFNTSLGESSVLDTPLALIFSKALEAPQAEQMKIFKNLGDTSLYFAGFFQDFFNRKTYDIDYFIAMGTTAYRNMSVLMRDRAQDQHFTEIYNGLAEQFTQLVEVVAEVSEPPPGDRPVDILATYDRWTKTQSLRLLKVLQKSGISPIRVSTKTEQ